MCLKSSRKVWRNASAMNRLDAMSLFVRVAELGSFSAAALQLGLARAVVTRQIAALEAHLGVKLMARSTRRLSLTSAGSAYLEKCRTILALVEEAEAGVMEARQMPSGPLRLSVPLSFGLRRLLPLLLEFAQTYPSIHLSLDFSDRRQDLIGEGCDLSIRVTHQLDPGQVARRLGGCQLQAVVSPDYLAQHAAPQHPSELLNHACLGYSPTLFESRAWSFIVDGSLHAVAVPSCLQANNGDALVAAAVQGFGITLQPDFLVADEIAAGRLVRVLSEFATPPLGIYALLPSNRYLPHRVKVLLEFLASRLNY